MNKIFEEYGLVCSISEAQTEARKAEETQIAQVR